MGTGLRHQASYARSKFAGTSSSSSSVRSRLAWTSLSRTDQATKSRPGGKYLLVDLAGSLVIAWLPRYRTCSAQ